MEHLTSNASIPYILLSSRLSANGQESGGLEILTNNDGTLSVVFNGTVNNVASYSSNAGFITKEAWHHVVVTRKDNTYEVFYDGQKVTTGSINPNFPPTNNPVWTVGSMLQGGSSIHLQNPNIIRSFNGQIDDIQFFNRTIDQTIGEVNNLFNTGVITHLEDAQLKETFSVYPNPATNYIFIESKAKVQIFDVTGNLVLSEISEGFIDVSSLDKGHYILQKDNQRTKLLIE